MGGRSRRASPAPTGQPWSAEVVVDELGTTVDHAVTLEALAPPLPTALRPQPSGLHEKRSPYFEITADGAITIDRRATGCRHAVWYSAVAGVPRNSRITQHDKNALRVEPA
jgi:hypothetical protein